eukprot:632460-Hanusia_phi.AAC.5
MAVPVLTGNGQERKPFIPGKQASRLLAAVQDGDPGGDECQRKGFGGGEHSVRRLELACHKMLRAKKAWEMEGEERGGRWRGESERRQERRG